MVLNYLRNFKIKQVFVAFYIVYIVLTIPGFTLVNINDRNCSQIYLPHVYTSNLKSKLSTRSQWPTFFCAVRLESVILRRSFFTNGKSRPSINIDDKLRVYIK